MNNIFFHGKFSEKPINFLTATIDQSPLPTHYNKKTTEDDNKIQESMAIENLEKPSPTPFDLEGLDNLEKDIQWISNLEQLNQIVQKYNEIIIPEADHRGVVGSGKENAILVIGESPDALDGQWDSFVGDHRILLKKMLNYININLEDVYLTTFSYWRPQNNRTFKVEEISLLRKFILKHIQIVKPKKILLLGTTAAQGVLNINKPLNGIRGSVYYVDEIPTVVTFNPGFLKRFPNFSTEAKKDMDLLKNL
jgi:DNA polymerase